MQRAEFESRDREAEPLSDIVDPGASRKRFIELVGGAGAAGAFATLLAACGDDEEETTVAGETPITSPRGDVEIVQFALTLELLEEDFYQQVRRGGDVRDAEASRLVNEVHRDEKEHVDALTLLVENLGFPPTPPPRTDFDSVLGGGEQEILETAAMLENLGAAAYLGQAANIQDPEILAAALSIHTVEARHAARFNELAGNGFDTGSPLRGSVPDGAFATGMEMEEVLEEIQPYLAS
jgi:rubrerythrin